MRARKYFVVQYDEEMELTRAESYGSWAIEGEFIITWTEDHLRRANRLEINCTRVETEPTFSTIEGVALDYADSAE